MFENWCRSVVLLGVTILLVECAGTYLRAIISNSLTRAVPMFEFEKISRLSENLIECLHFRLKYTSRLKFLDKMIFKIKFKPKLLRSLV